MPGFSGVTFWLSWLPTLPGMALRTRRIESGLSYLDPSRTDYLIPLCNILKSSCSTPYEWRWRTSWRPQKSVAGDVSGSNTTVCADPTQCSTYPALNDLSLLELEPLLTNKRIPDARISHNIPDPPMVIFFTQQYDKWGVVNKPSCTAGPTKCQRSCSKPLWCG